MYKQRWQSRIFLIIGLITSVMTHSTTTPALNPDHPNSYIMKEGDTLWDISSIFLEDQWLWPEIWRAYPQLQNPHLIYPGDSIHFLSDSKSNHQPYLKLIRSNTTNHSVVLNNPPNDAIKSNHRPLPMQALSPLFSQPLLVEPSHYAQAAEIIGARDQRLMFSQGDEVYVIGNETLPKNQIYAIVRVGKSLFDPVTDEPLGYQVLHIGEGVITRSSDFSTLTINKSFREVLPGDRLLNIENIHPPQNWHTSVAHNQLSAQIIDLPGALSQVGSYQIIIINAGHQHQLSPGQLLSIQRHVKHTHPNHSASHKTSDEINFPQPSSTQEVLGSAVAFRVFEKISYCLILSAERPIRIGDRVENSLMR